jgi:hypothetical protein
MIQAKLSKLGCSCKVPVHKCKWTADESSDHTTIAYSSNIFTRMQLISQWVGFSFSGGNPQGCNIFSYKLKEIRPIDSFSAAPMYMSIDGLPK